ncbi:MAG: sigma 54-interacting transcriptional regulator [Puniceicoccales bacterium]|jgi:Nif-specific regulatory protein|nr:sigma 54-interacting transcriptional regulator [Puniceicoccales bacterium]
MGIDNFDEIAGGSQSMRSVYFLVEQVASSKTTVLIRGETGVGKERIAEAIWQGGPRNARPFVRVNCAALSENLIESELFGHEKGAFTGALALRRGRFELANTGTLFLDEIGELSLSTQAKLLRVLQEGTFERVGGTETHKVDVRIIAATNRDLEAMIEDGRFRLDLYYRINVFPIYVPPLRERPCDLLQLANTFLERFAWQNRKRINRISTPAIDMLTTYHWPGNVRELENVMERAVLLATGDTIHGSHLPPTLQLPAPVKPRSTAGSTSTGGGGEADGSEDGDGDDGDARPGTLPAALRLLKLEMLTDALKASRGNKAAAARQLGITEKVMLRYLREVGLNASRFRHGGHAGGGCGGTGDGGDSDDGAGDDDA